MHSSELGAVSVLNPSPLPAASQLQQFPWDLLHWLVVNEGEAKGILSALALDDPNKSEEQKSATQNDTVAHAGMLLRTLHSSPAFSPRINLVCTLGAHGVIALIPALSPSGSVDVLYLPAAHLQGPVVDTTGAGDCFTGYLIAGLMEIKCTTKEDIMAVLQRAIEVSLVLSTLMHYLLSAHSASTGCRTLRPEVRSNGKHSRQGRGGSSLLVQNLTAGTA